MASCAACNASTEFISRAASPARRSVHYSLGDISSGVWLRAEDTRLATHSFVTRTPARAGGQTRGGCWGRTPWLLICMVPVVLSPFFEGIRRGSSAAVVGLCHGGETSPSDEMVRDDGNGDEDPVMS